MEVNKFNKFKNCYKEKGCFKGDNNCSSTIINAHSIQNNRILNHISRNGYVMYYDYSNNMPFELRECGRKKATTFRGFCEYHDTKIFEPIELFDYEYGNRQQEFLFAYRALAKEYFDKHSVVNITNELVILLRDNNHKKLMELLPNYNEKKNEYYLNEFSIINSGSQVALNRLNKNRIAMNNNYDKCRYSKITTDRIVFNEEFLITATSACIIQYDVYGNIVNDLMNVDSSYISPLFFTLFPQKGKTYVLLSYFTKDKNKFEFIKKQILNEEDNLKKVILSNIIICYIENFAFSPIVWEKWTLEKRKEISKVFRDTINIKPRSLIDNKEINLFN